MQGVGESNNNSSSSSSGVHVSAHWGCGVILGVFMKEVHRWVACAGGVVDCFSSPNTTLPARYGNWIVI